MRRRRVVRLLLVRQLLLRVIRHTIPSMRLRNLLNKPREKCSWQFSRRRLFDRRWEKARGDSGQYTIIRESNDWFRDGKSIHFRKTLAVPFI